MQVEELSAVRQTLQADLETSIRRIVDLQAALEEVESSDESDTERYRWWHALDFSRSSFLCSPVQRSKRTLSANQFIYYPDCLVFKIVMDSYK